MITTQEERIESPIWLEYQIKHILNGKKKLCEMNERIKRFEKEHPQLRLIHAEHATQEVKVMEDPVLFSNQDREFRQIKYTFLRHTITLYYEPSEDLHTFLVLLQELIERIKDIRMRIKKNRNW